MLHLSEFVAAVARAVVTGSVSPSHARVVRQCWNKLKSVGEAFVRACERGPCRTGHPAALTQRRYN